jgi:hypothetical protein
LKGKPSRELPTGLFTKRLCDAAVLVGEHSLILTAAVLIDDALAGFLIDLVALPSGLRDIFRCRLVAVAEKNHRLIVRVRSLVVLMRWDADNLPL